MIAGRWERGKKCDRDCAMLGEDGAEEEEGDGDAVFTRHAAPHICVMLGAGTTAGCRRDAAFACFMVFSRCGAPMDRNFLQR